MDRKIERSFYEKNKTKLIILTLTTFVLVSFSLYGLDSVGTLVINKEKVRLFTVKKDNFQEFIPIDANVIPLKTIYLDAVAGGQVENVYVEDGKTLKEGEPILKLSNTNLVLDVMYREAQLFEQENQLRNTRITFEQNRLQNMERLANTEYQILRAKRNFKRDSILFNKNLIARHELDLSIEEYNFQKKQLRLVLQSIRQDSIFRSTQIEQLVNSVERLKSNYSIVKETLEKLTIKSPMDGQITSFDIEVGQSINQRQRIGQLDIVNQYRAEALVDEHYLPKLHIGQKAIGISENEEIILEIKKVYPLVQNGRVKIDLSFGKKRPKQLTRGQRIQLKLELSGKKQELLLKRGGFYTETGGAWIFVRSKKDGVFIKREIELGRQNPNYFVVKDGLDEGDEVIISSYDAYKNIEKIKF